MIESTYIDGIKSSCQLLSQAVKDLRDFEDKLLKAWFLKYGGKN